MGFGLLRSVEIKHTMSAERRQRLDEIGFIWDALEMKWEEGFSALMQFKEREGHCRVSQGFIERSCWLGQWVGVQRSTKSTMSAKRRQRLG